MIVPYHAILNFFISSAGIRQAGKCRGNYIKINFKLLPKLACKQANNNALQRTLDIYAPLDFV